MKKKTECQGWWLWQRCVSANYEASRPNNDTEKQKIEEAVKSKSFDSFKSRILTEFDDFEEESKPHVDQKAGSATQDKKH